MAGIAGARVMSARKDKGRLPPFVPVDLEMMNSPAWRATSFGARWLYMHLKRRWQPVRVLASTYREITGELSTYSLGISCLYGNFPTTLEEEIHGHVSQG